MKGFYANLYVDEVDESFEKLMLKSKVNGIVFHIDEALLTWLFYLSDSVGSVLELSLWIYCVVR